MSLTCILWFPTSSSVKEIGKDDYLMWIPMMEQMANVMPGMLHERFDQLINSGSKFTDLKNICSNVFYLLSRRIYLGNTKFFLYNFS